MFAKTPQNFLPDEFITSELSLSTVNDIEQSIITNKPYTDGYSAVVP